MTAPTDRPRAVIAAQALVAFIGALWVFIAILTLLRPTAGPAATIILAVLMLVNAAIMFWLARGLGRQSKRHYYITLAYLGVVIVMFIIDQFGLIDLVGLLLTLAPFVLLLATRPLYTALPPE